ncbi:MAG: transferase [Rubrivivax sp.]|nr:transferase [Rubrivivax sp.]
MPDSAESDLHHVKPFVYETPNVKALHFSISEVQSRMQVRHPDALDLEYTRTMMGFLLFHPAPRHLTMIGLGGGSLAKFCHRHLPRTHIRAVEINPHVIALRDSFQVPPDGPRFEVVRGDGARLVREAAVPCDVLLVDGYDSSGLPSRLGMARFYDDCHDALEPGGVLVVNLHSGHHRFDILVDRMRRSFDDSVLLVDASDRSNTIVFAFKDRDLADLRRGALRPPQGLDGVAFKQLRADFAAVVTALAAQDR